MRNLKLDNIFDKLFNYLPHCLAVALAICFIREQQVGGPRASFHIICLIISIVFVKQLTVRALEYLAYFAVALAAYFIWTIFGLLSNWCASCDPTNKFNLMTLVGTTVYLGGLLAITPFKLAWAKNLAMPIALAPIVQVALLLTHPKVCPPCITLGVLSVICYEYVSRQSLATGSKSSSWRFASVISIFCCLPLLAYSRQPYTIENMKAVEIGTDFFTLIPSLAADNQKTLNNVVLATLPGCSWCEKARIALKSNSVRFTEISVNEFESSNRHTIPSTAPQIFVLKNGVILKHIVGFDLKEIENIGK